MLSRPRFRPHFHVEVIPGEGVLLLSDSRQTLLRGRLYELVTPWLDGRTTEDVCHQLRGTASPAAVFYTLTQLELKDYLCEEEQSLPAGQASLWSSQQITPATAAHSLAERPIVVRALGVEAGPFLDLLQSLHVQVSDTGLPDVVLTDSYLRSELQACNAEAMQAGRPWLLVKLSGRQVWIWPLFTPGKTGCWQCLALRLRSNSPVVSFLQSRNGHAGAALHDRASTPATLRVAEGLAANAVASWIVPRMWPACWAVARSRRPARSCSFQETASGGACSMMRTCRGRSANSARGTTRSGRSGPSSSITSCSR